MHAETSTPQDNARDCVVSWSGCVSMCTNLYGHRLPNSTMGWHVYVLCFPVRFGLQPVSVAQIQPAAFVFGCSCTVFALDRKNRLKDSRFSGQTSFKLAAIVAFTMFWFGSHQMSQPRCIPRSSSSLIALKPMLML